MSSLARCILNVALLSLSAHLLDIEPIIRQHILACTAPIGLVVFGDAIDPTPTGIRQPLFVNRDALFPQVTRFAVAASLVGNVILVNL